jgi:hypothetical protein
MIQAARIIGTGMATTGLIGAEIGYKNSIWCLNTKYNQFLIYSNIKIYYL